MSSPDGVLEARERLAGCTEPYLIGVRHHSPALAAAVPAMLRDAAPQVLFVELPEEFAPWLPYLADPGTRPPVALAGTVGGADGPVFLPFAEFSPELAAIRWAREEDVEVVPFDLPLGARGSGTTPPGPHEAVRAEDGTAGALAAALRARAGGRPGDDLWDRLVEASAPGSGHEAVRRAALLVGWALRSDAGRVDGYDLRREANMRRLLGSRPGLRAAAVVGAFHAPALLPDRRGREPETEVSDADRAEVTTSLVPYAYPLLDERSGYPAGIRDPEWQHGVHRAAGDPALLDAFLVSTAVRICAAVRDAGHPSGPADAREVVRVARDLASLRGLPAAGRGELTEAVQTVLTQGRLLGRGRAVAAAMEKVLVGERQGRLATGTPRSGLGPSVEALLAQLSLPTPEAPARREFRLDAHRSGLDRRREVCLRRLAVCRVPYGTEAEVAGVGDAAPLTTRWAVAWSPATGAMLDVAGVHGVTLEQAATGVLRQRWATERHAGGPTAAQVLAGLEEAARCGLPALARERLAEWGAALPAAATLPELLAGLALVDRIGAGHLPGLPAGWERAALDAAAQGLAAAGVRALDGLAGSTDPRDARALVSLAGGAAEALGGGLRLEAALAALETDATPLVRGAAGAVRVLLGQRDPTDFGVRVASRVDGAAGSERRKDLAEFLRGTLLAAGPLLETDGALDPLLERIESLGDRAFLDRLPALRAGFDALSPAARGRLLAAVEDRTGSSVGTLPGTDRDPLVRALLAAADLAGREALAAHGLRSPGAVDRSDGRVRTERPARESAGASTTRSTGPLDGSETPAAQAGSRKRRHEAEADDGSEESATGPGDRTAADGEAAGRAVVPGGGAGRSDTSDAALTAGDRWRLVLGRPQGLGGRASRVAGALDELYGHGRGEGSRDDGSGGRGNGGGAEASFPDVRSWSEELAALFGPGVREEVLAAAVGAGRLDAATEIDPASARPSVELLRTVLSYAGGMPEQQLARLRPLVSRLVDELTKELAQRLRPALTGLAHPRPTRRSGGPLDLARTLRANLATARRDPGSGAVSVLPERPVFRTRARRESDWRLILVVDVSGSMEASTIWAALTAAVLAGVPSVSTRFIAFSTEVLDLTDHVDDPLGLLLEVRVGGGTSIARGLRHARSLVSVPSRTLTVLISDFEEGGPVGPLLAEVRAMVDAGVHVLGCASLDDEGRPRYSTGVAGQLVAAGMPVAALSPLELARWVGERVGGAYR